MANKRMSTIFFHLFLIVLSSQLPSLHGRSVAGEYTRHNAANRGAPGYSDKPVTFSTEWKSQSNMPSFAMETDAYNYVDEKGAADKWDSVNFSTQNTATQTEGSTENVQTYDTYVDSPEQVQGDSSSLADQTLYQSDNRFSYRDPHDNDEVYFDTSSADVVYKAKDDGLSFSTYSGNATSTDEMLVTLAKAMGGCGTGNPIDDCWRCDSNWRSHRQSLANCAVGFGRNAIGGKNGPLYTVTNNGDDLQNPQPGTLRYGVTRNGPLWIIFANSMNIQLKGELWITAYKTIDGRGANVHITGGSQLTIQNTNNVIIHGLHIHDIKPSGPANIRASPSKLISRGLSDGDGIHIWGSKNVWVDHCYLAKATDGLLDATRGSSFLTVSNTYFENHNKVMLFGSHNNDYVDRGMRATVTLNKFGPGLIQRMPRCRFGVFHVLNNDYSAGWGLYAIGGSEDPTILSQGNVFNPAGGRTEVTKRINDNGPTFGGWQKWNWGSDGDDFLNGAYFTGSGAKASTAGVYAEAYSATARSSSLVPAMTNSAGPLSL